MNETSSILTDTVINAVVEVADAVECLVDTGLVTVNYRADLDAIVNTGQQDTGTSRWDMLGLDVAVSLDHAEDNSLVLRCNVLAAFATTDIGFVCFNHARERIAILEHEGTHMLGNAPGGFVCDA